MTRLDLIREVALRMDEVTPDIPVSGLTVDGADNNPLYALIDGLVDAGALELFSVAPYWRLPQVVFTSPGIIVEALPPAFGDRSSSGPGGLTTVTTRYIIRLKVPDGFLRVAEINCTGFLRPITEVCPEISDMGRRQHNRVLMAKESRPVGVMSHGEWPTSTENVYDQCMEIDCYSVSTNVATSAVKASYIAKPSDIDDDDTNTDAVEEVVPPVLVPALEWLIAARTFGARGDVNHAAVCQQNAQNLLV